MTYRTRFTLTMLALLIILALPAFTCDTYGDKVLNNLATCEAQHGVTGCRQVAECNSRGGTNCQPSTGAWTVDEAWNALHPGQ